MKEQQIKMIQKIKKIDKSLVDLNFDVTVGLRKIYFGLAGDKGDFLT